jgi:hypothetical protein
MLKFFKGIKLHEIWAALFPADFHQKYIYLGAVPWNEGSEVFRAIEPLVIYMDYKAKPWWCPRWFLRLLHLFGNDNSIIRVSNWPLHNLKNKITKGYLIWDYKTKWEWYDLRISVSGTVDMHFLSDAIEGHFYRQNLRKELAERIKELDPSTVYHNGYDIETLKKELYRLEDEHSSKDNL